ncbi:hypothetical protein BDZ45DRAFT_747878 [Acephala macrosclerotiorum]|nr:hypothetical protein BDZ45DRAFT_747878 [Acephala macrosclerotiorum]
MTGTKTAFGLLAADLSLTYRLLHHHISFYSVPAFDYNSRRVIIPIKSNYRTTKPEAYPLFHSSLIKNLLQISPMEGSEPANLALKLGGGFYDGNIMAFTCECYYYSKASNTSLYDEDFERH